MFLLRYRSLFLRLATLSFVILMGKVDGQEADSHYDFSSATMINFTANTPVELAAIEFLVEEVNKKTGLTIESSDQRNTESGTIVLGTKSSLKASPYASLLSSSTVLSKDGFEVATDRSKGKDQIIIAGNDERGLLFGIGYVLRKSNLSSKGFFIPRNISVVTAPETPLRGHQLGYRPKVNSYDGFTVDMWEQYIRDLMVFGTNAIELMPPNTDDDKDSPMFTLPPAKMLVEMSSLLEKYGLDVWMWYPLMHGDYQQSEVVQNSLAENDEIFKSMPKLDAVFVPGGDPGRQDPKVLFEHLERKIKVLHKYHPDAEIWISPQGYSAAWMDEFIELLGQNPQWLTGIVHGPWVRMDVNDLRKVVPDHFPIRRYPDITHSIDGQYFVPHWDFAYTVTQNRETINPRPLDHAKVYRSVTKENSIGFITYSEGVNDDVNKIIWSGLGWDRSEEVIDILRDYSRYFIGPEYEDDFAQGLLNLERNWSKGLMNNPLVPVHHQIFETMEAKASPQVKLNWRFQSALYRSYYDAYNYYRLIYETQLEQEAMMYLHQVDEWGLDRSIAKARAVLAQATEARIFPQYRQRIFELAEALFQSIRMQLSVEKYHAIATIRGGNLDLIDSPLNNRKWLEKQFDQIEKIDDLEKQKEALWNIVHWKNPGPGGYYDDLGDMENQPHMVYTLDYEKDPNSFKSSFAGLPGGYSLEMDRIEDWRVSWKTYMQTIFDQPMKMRYEDLDPKATYQVKVTYVEDQPIRLRAGGEVLIHDYLLPSEDPKPQVFEVPPSAIREGVLELVWNIRPGGMGPGRGCSVAEVWLMKK